jgi:myo-inositol-1(or 4)-monophosphatase
MMTMVGLTQDKDDQLYFNKLINLAIEHKYKIRMLGSIGLEMALASEGVYDFLYTNVTNYWDIFPGILLLKESGAKLYNELGQDYQIGDVHMFSYKSKQVKEIINKYMK